MSRRRPPGYGGQAFIGSRVGLTARVRPEEGDGMLLRRVRGYGRFLVAVVVFGWPAPAASDPAVAGLALQCRPAG